MPIQGAPVDLGVLIAIAGGHGVYVQDRRRRLRPKTESLSPQASLSLRWTPLPSTTKVTLCRSKEPRARQRYWPASSGRKLAISKRPLQPRTRPAGVRRLPSLYQWPLRSARPQHNRRGCPRATVSSCSCCSGLGARQGSVGQGQRSVSPAAPCLQRTCYTHDTSTLNTC